MTRRTSCSLTGGHKRSLDPIDQVSSREDKVRWPPSREKLVTQCPTGGWQMRFGIGMILPSDCLTGSRSQHEMLTSVIHSLQRIQREEELAGVKC